MQPVGSAKATKSNVHVYFLGKGNRKLKYLCFRQETKKYLEKAWNIIIFLLEMVKNRNSEGINNTTTGQLQMFMSISESIDNIDASCGRYARSGFGNKILKRRSYSRSRSRPPS